MLSSFCVRSSGIYIRNSRVVGHARTMVTSIGSSKQTLDSVKVKEKDILNLDEKDVSKKPSLKRSLEKDQIPSFPVSGIFAVVKPSGPTSMQILDKLKPMLGKSKVFQQTVQDPEGNKRQRSRRNRRGGVNTVPKLGQGGTLDPLADGVLVIGIGSGTKKLQQFLDCSKEYRTVGLLGCSTLSYDSEDPILERKSFDHVKRDDVEKVLHEFEGDSMQLPPLYSAVKIDGKRLLDYARAGEDLPRPVEARKITIHHSSLARWQTAEEHQHDPPDRECSIEERKIAKRARRLAGLDSDSAESEEDVSQSIVSDSNVHRAPAFTADLTVSSGTYIRTIVHELGQKLNSAAHVVKLTRTRQGQWVVPGYERKSNETTQLREAIEWEVLENAIADFHEGESAKKKKIENGQSQSTDQNRDGEDLQEWEKLILERIEVC